MLRNLYDWTIRQAHSPYALWILAAIAFAESSFFPIPQEALMIPMIIAAPERAWRIALVATAASVAGAILGYWIGSGFYESLGRPILEFYGKADMREQLSGQIAEYGGWAIAIGALTPFPFKVTTIGGGALGVDFTTFVVVSILGRGLRFFLIAALLRQFGDPIRDFIERRLGLVATVSLALLIGGFAVLKYAI